LRDSLAHASVYATWTALIPPPGCWRF
jgi:hypothetical protein